MSKNNSRKLLTVERIKDKIHQVRGKKVMLDEDLAELYGVQTKVLIQAVKRNIKCFPDDFMHHLAWKELMSLRSQFATSKRPGSGGRRYCPYGFTEQGVAMLSTVLNSERAITVNIQIMRAFVALRRWVIPYEGLRRKIDDMEKKYDGKFQVVFTALKELMAPPPEKPKRRIGFGAEQPTLHPLVAYVCLFFLNGPGRV